MTCLSTGAAAAVAYICHLLTTTAHAK